MSGRREGATVRGTVLAFVLAAVSGGCSWRSDATVETAKDATYRVSWRGSSLIAIEPRGARVPLYADRARLRHETTPLGGPRYP